MHYFLVSIQNNEGYIGVVYRSPIQDANEFQNLLPNFETNLSDTTTKNTLFTVILSDFNTTYSAWWTNDKTTIEGTKLESVQLCMGFINSYHSPLI